MSEVELSEAAPGGYTVSLPSFEGPLDLLLHLCQKHELDILDIPIAFVTEKYLEFLAVMQMIDLDLASEYLVMAATLAHIKSKQLLPAPPPGQEDDAASGEEEDPREALIRRLLEYQKYKQAAADLASRGVAGRDVFLRGMKLEEAVDTGLPPLAQVPLFSLVEAFQGVLSRSKIKLSHDIVHERMTLTDRINELVDVLRAKKRVQFEDLFDGLTTRFDLVITFLALLEMTKLRMTRLYQADPDAPIFVEFAAQVAVDDEPLERTATGDETAEATRAATPANAGGGTHDGTAELAEQAGDLVSDAGGEAPTQASAPGGDGPRFDDAAIDALAATERGWDFDASAPLEDDGNEDAEAAPDAGAPVVDLPPATADDTFVTLPPDAPATLGPTDEDAEQDVGVMDLAALAARFAPAPADPKLAEGGEDLHVTRFDTTRSGEAEAGTPSSDDPSAPLDTERPAAGSSCPENVEDEPRGGSSNVTDDAVPSSEDDSDQA